MKEVDNKKCHIVHDVIHVILLFLVLIYFSSCATNKLTKYRFVLTNTKGKPLLKTQDQMLKIFLENTEKYPLQFFDKRGKFKKFSDDIFNLESTNRFLLPDSITGIFKVARITERQGNYYLKEGEIADRIVHFIDIESTSTNDTICPMYMRLISVDNPETNGEKIKIGESYKMKIYSFFKEDCCMSKNENGEIIYSIRPPDNGAHSYLFEDMWMIDMSLGNYNFFETPNLKGLYYLPCK